MRVIKPQLVLMALACVIVLGPTTASARVSFSIGVGTCFGDYCCPYGWYDHWGWPCHWPAYGPVCPPTVGLWVYDPWPVIVDAPPVVIKERHVIIKTDRPAKPAPEVGDTIVAEKLGQDKSELVKRLRIGDVSHRIAAAHALLRFSGDGQVRGALERALLADRDAAVREAVAEVLGKLGDKKVVTSLKHAYAQDPSREVRQTAYRALILIEGY